MKRLFFSAMIVAVGLALVLPISSLAGTTDSKPAIAQADAAGTMVVAKRVCKMIKRCRKYGSKRVCLKFKRAKHCLKWKKVGGKKICIKFKPVKRCAKYGRKKICIKFKLVKVCK
ncbi:MAG: hypothetical protein KJ621_02510 [Proteobacteria bacterium]|nr:hypothetical protein [Pseudomonadota bacterium]MBU1741031.1 hypothetical protein [Pseudomonadota bacterium]